MRILLVEDDQAIANGVCTCLTSSSYSVDHCENGCDADLALQHNRYDVVVLDLGLPGMEGTEVLSKLRERGDRVPVLVLTARDTIDDRIQGFDLGADDYVTKPFDLREIEARIKALARRSSPPSSVVCIGNLKLDVANRTVTAAGKVIELSIREISILQVLLDNPSKVVTKEAILSQICSDEESLGVNAVEVYIHRLRKKLGTAGLDLKTVRGIGYLLQ